MLIRGKNFSVFSVPLWLILKMDITNKDDIKNILVFQTAFLGDVVLSTPIFKNIKKHFKNAKVTAVVIPGSEPILRGNPYIDAIITDDKKGGNRLRNFFLTLSQIKRGQFDLIISLHRSFRTALMIYLSNVPRRVGFSDSAGSFLYTSLVKRDLTLHDVQRNLSILAGVGIVSAELTDELLVTYTHEDKASVISKMKIAGTFSGTKPIIIINPGSVWATKRYPLASYAKLVSLLKKDDRFDIVITGGKDDCKLAEEITRLCGGGIIDLTGKTSLKELTALLSLASLMITNDSGPMHIAASFNIPIVAIFGPTTRELGFFPYNKNSTVIEKELPCRPCGKHGGDKCKIGSFDCMNLIKPEEVYQNINMLYKNA